MRAENMENDRRNFMRYRMKESVFGAVHYPTTTIVGKIKDMSLGGAAFEFITSSPEAEEKRGRYFLDIFMLDRNDGLPNMPCTIFFRVPLTGIENGPHVFFSSVISHVCVAEFKDLTQPQARALLDFVMQYSIGYAT
jgi:hypothetical protein